MQLVESVSERDLYIAFDVNAMYAIIFAFASVCPGQSVRGFKFAQEVTVTSTNFWSLEFFVSHLSDSTLDERFMALVPKSGVF